MDYKEYFEQRLASLSVQEMTFQLLKDIFSANGIITPTIPIFYGRITEALNGKQYINSIKSIMYPNVPLTYYPFEFFRTNKWGDSIPASPSVTITSTVNAEANATVFFCVTTTTKESAILCTSSALCVSQSDLGISNDASGDAVLDVLREHPKFKGIIKNYENLLALDSLVTKRGEAEEKLSKIKETKKNLDEEISKLRETIKEANKKRDFLQRIGILSVKDDPQFDAASIEQFSGSFRELIAHAKSHMKASPKHLIYSEEEHIVERFFRAMFTNQLIILSGEPGSGKTSLPVAIAKAIGAECHLISVQPNWTDNQDLLGYYNPIDKRYISTPFLEALLAARKASEKIHFICLDEMNLAHIEYYFSGILSAMETEEKSLHLYVGPTFEQLTQEICSRYYPAFSELNESQKEQWISDNRNNPEFGALCKQWNEAFYYPPVVSIPDNVVFIGTLNMDETTKGISPKVLDRSFIIEINNNFNLDSQNDTSVPAEAVSITPADFLRIRRANSDETSSIEKGNIDSLYNSVQRIIAVWNEQGKNKDVDGLKEIHSSHRFMRQLEALLESAELTDSLFDILAGKILPLMQCDNMPDSCQTMVIEEFNQYAKNSYVVRKFERMISNDGQINFWWR